MGCLTELAALKKHVSAQWGDIFFDRELAVQEITPVLSLGLVVVDSLLY